jgi:hypothetical protein
MLTVRAVAANGTRDSDRLGIVLGGRLPIPAAALAIASFECDCTGDAPDTTEYLGRCRRMSRTRVDCRINARKLDTCEYVGSVVLRANGLVWTRQYGCPVRRKPAVRRSCCPPRCSSRPDNQLVGRLPRTRGEHDRLRAAVSEAASRTPGGLAA